MQWPVLYPRFYPRPGFLFSPLSPALLRCCCVAGQPPPAAGLVPGLKVSAGAPPLGGCSGRASRTRSGDRGPGANTVCPCALCCVRCVCYVVYGVLCAVLCGVRCCSVLRGPELTLAVVAVLAVAGVVM